MSACRLARSSAETGLRRMERGYDYQLQASACVERPMAEYKKLAQTGTWGIAVQGPSPTPGEKITVVTRKGKVKKEVVGRVVGSGSTSTGLPATLCTVVE